MGGEIGVGYHLRVVESKWMRKRNEIVVMFRRRLTSWISIDMFTTLDPDPQLVLQASEKLHMFFSVTLQDYRDSSWR